MTLLKSKTPDAGEVQPFAFAYHVEADQETSGANCEAGADLAVEGETHLPQSLAKESELTGRIAELEAKIAIFDEGLERAREAGFEAGKIQGKESAKEEGDAVAEWLQAALVSAETAFQDHLANEHDAAIAIAKSILAKVLGEVEDLSALVIQAAAQGRRDLAKSTLLTLRVSANDFRDPDALTSLTAAVGQIKIEVDSTLASGACIFDLSLGELDASLPRQFANAREFLEQYTSSRGAS